MHTTAEGEREVLFKYHRRHSTRPMDMVVRTHPTVATAKAAIWALALLMRSMAAAHAGNCKKTQSIVSAGPGTQNHPCVRDSGHVTFTLCGREHTASTLWEGPFGAIHQKP